MYKAELSLLKYHNILANLYDRIEVVAILMLFSFVATVSVLRLLFGLELSLRCNVG